MRLTGFSVFSLHAAYAASHFRAEILLLIHRGCQIPISRCLQAIYHVYKRSTPKRHRIPTPFLGRVTTPLPVGTEPIMVVELTESIENLGRKLQVGQDTILVICHVVRNTRETRREILLV
ncbi:hypothetical protein T02_6042 [Trichinella nativa]|uniref:Uncharacterized protein n=1 Tax=Trichinella nativa TaxID=6335 RepID=A0A0V1L157_9BILA|nr:hypothetical protein T02_6042 [Trichinella nativa]